MRRSNWILAFVLLLIVCMLPINQIPVSAEVEGDPMIVVSLGDSYSSGEGIEPFYGQSKSEEEKIYDRDWLAHRSERGWPTMLKVPGYSGTTANYRVNTPNDEYFQWYFAASSGAVTKNVYRVGQEKKAVRFNGLSKLTWTDTLPIQTDIFEGLTNKVDYVTMTMGGNDVDFANIITTCVMGSTYLGSKALDEKLDSLWADIDYIKTCLNTTYEEIASKAGPQAAIIIAGYPKLLDKNGKGAVISLHEATQVNDSVNRFNDVIEGLVNDNKLEGMNIHFVDVEEAFDEGEGHQAFSPDSWINEIMPVQNQDINSTDPISKYCIHPNYKGAQAYARCVNAKIAEIENNKAKGTLSGKICKATDRTTPIPNAQVSVYKDGVSYMPNVDVKSDAYGNYSLSLEEGFYKVEIRCSGYVTFSSYATVTKNQNTYMETFLLVQGTLGEKDYAKGRITNALTGSGVPNANIEVREGWNNTEYGDVVATAKTDASGNYSLFLPVGNFTLNISKPGFISGTVNVIVQRGLNVSQNGSISPNGNGEDYRIVLTWGENPRDLDSHLVGKLSNDGVFHVYYGRKSQYDGEEEVCNLDVDDVTSYGPETITLKALSETPYYYYIHHFAGSGSIASSEAVIKIYQGSELIQTINVPTDQGNDIYWNVFAIVNGQIQIKNTITHSPDTSYASNQIARYSLRDEYSEILLTDSSAEKESSDEEKNTEIESETESSSEDEDIQETTTEEESTEDESVEESETESSSEDEGVPETTTEEESTEDEFVEKTETESSSEDEGVPETTTEESTEDESVEEIETSEQFETESEGSVTILLP